MPANFSFARTFSMAVLAGLISLSLAGCAVNPKDPISSGDEAAVYDPIEPVNRVTLAFNEVLDKILFNPITTVYRTIVPEVGRTAVHNVLDNLKSPVYAANELLQGNVSDAGVVAKRFAINTIVGVGGIVDMAGKQGITYQPEDFGQTLATWGVGSGPYIVWPILGPSTLRDSVGFVADMAMDPIYWYATNGDHDAIKYTRTGLTVLDSKDRTYDLMHDLRRNSGDLYTSLQSVYVQRRKALVDDLDPTKTALPTIE